MKFFQQFVIVFHVSFKRNSHSSLPISQQMFVLRRAQQGETVDLCRIRGVDDLRAEQADVAVVLADQWLPGTTGTDLLTHVRDVHPEAKRGLLIRWGDWADRATADAVLRAMALGRIDCYVLKPWCSPDELFHRTVAELVHDGDSGAPVGAPLVRTLQPARGLGRARKGLGFVPDFQALTAWDDAERKRRR